MRYSWLGAVLLLGCSGQALARDWPDAGGFTIVEGEEYCAFTTEYQGPGETRLSVALNRDASAYIMVENLNWTSKQDQAYEDIEFRLNGRAFAGGVAAGTEEGPYKGFIVRSSGDIMNNLAASSYLHIYKADQQIDRLDLEGSGAAVAAVRRCVAHINGLRRAEERERNKWKDLPSDPFAK